jgi:hypothetical protein
LIPRVGAAVEVDEVLLATNDTDELVMLEVELTAVDLELEVDSTDETEDAENIFELDKLELDEVETFELVEAIEVVETFVNDETLEDDVVEDATVVLDDTPL